MSRQSRIEILGRLHGRARVAGDVTPIWTTRRAYADLAAQFTAALTAAGGEVVRVADGAAALAVVGELLETLGTQRLVVNGDPLLRGLGVTGRFAAYQPFVVGLDKGDLRAACSAADVGLSGAAAALAETGTLVVNSGPALARLATLLPPVHIALVPVAALESDLLTWMAARGTSLPAHVTLISGPSKTADIEMTLAVGVHGPGRFIAVLIDG